MTNQERSRTIPLRFSALKHMAKSPRHYLHAITEERTDSRAMRMGRAIHALVLGGNIDVFDGGDRRAKGYAEFERNAKSDTVLTNPEYYEALRVAKAVKEDSAASDALYGKKEELLETQLNSRALRGTPDAYSPDKLVLTDLKSTQCSDPSVFSRHAVEMQYPNQLAWYRMLIKLVHGVEMRTFRLVAVESSAPYNVSVINVPLELIDEAQRQNMIWFNRLLECEATGNFPGYTNGSVVELVRRQVELPFMRVEDAIT